VGSYSEAVDNQLLKTTPSAVIAVGPKGKSISGEDYAKIGTGTFSIVVDEQKQGAIYITQLIPTLGRPDDPRFRGWRMEVVDIATGQVLDTRLCKTADGKTVSNWFPTPSMVKQVSVRALSYADPNSTDDPSDDFVNPYVQGVTPEVIVSVGRTGSLLDLTLATPGTLQTAANTEGLELPAIVNVAPNGSGRLTIAKQTNAVLNTYGGKRKLYSWDANAGNYYHKADAGDFEADSVTSGVVAAGVVGSREMITGELLIGLGGGKPTKLKVVDGFGSMIMFCGYDPATGFLGLRAINAGFGPDPNNPNFYSDYTGTYIQNTPFTLTRTETTGGETYIASINSAFQAGYGGATFTGFQVQRSDCATHRAVLINRGLVGFLPSGQQAFAMVSFNGDNTGLDYTAPFFGEAYVCDTGGNIVAGMSGQTGRVTGNSFVSAGSAYSLPPLILGNYYLWVDSSGRLRIKSSTPTSDTDGEVVGAQ
jgi:hypothetical protein